MLQALIDEPHVRPVFSINDDVPGCFPGLWCEYDEVRVIRIRPQKLKPVTRISSRSVQHDGKRRIAGFHSRLRDMEQGPPLCPELHIVCSCRAALSRRWTGARFQTCNGGGFRSELSGQ